MATKDERSRLLSKVALFVRNPTKDWSELDQPMQPEESSYDKQALKAMIERKRQNDFVRRREFDQLRKLRNRDPGAMAGLGRPSYFQNSLPTDMDGRAVTLKKIDEIEAQMSKQWWKNKAEAGAGGADPATASTQPLPVTESGAAASKPSEALSDMDFAATQMSTAGVPPSGPSSLHESSALAAGLGAGDAGFSSSKLLAVQVDQMTTDPELEEAAIRYANGDPLGAERGLLQALRGKDVAFAAGQSWLGALLDLYRATDRQAEFGSATLEFAGFLGDIRPVWVHLAVYRPSAAAPLASGSGALHWESPWVLGLDAMERMREVMASTPMPWSLSWAPLEQIMPDAFPLLDGLFQSLCEEGAKVRFYGVERLLDAIRAVTPSGNRQVEQGWWLLRLNILRALQMQDDFELVALDFCVTYEEVPPLWRDARCEIDCMTGTVPALLTEVESPTAPMQLGVPEGPHVLTGEVLGDATEVLAQIEESALPGAPLQIGCGALLRVDFAAAGSILNWVALREAAGRQIQFNNVHRLVAAFFNVIGINEHAKVVHRPI